jgi:hypothetical protein
VKNEKTVWAPIALFVYNRPLHTAQTLKALGQNRGIERSALHVFADGPRHIATTMDLSAIEATRRLCRSFPAAKAVILHESPVNKGLAASITEGISRILDTCDRVIVLEDDLITSPGFLEYMNSALCLYQEVPQVMEIAGYIYPVATLGLRHPTLFYNVNSCWGWGTWRRAWQHYCGDAEELKRRVDGLRGHRSFRWRFNGGQDDKFYEQLRANAEGRLNTWAVRWHTSMFLRAGLCLHPRKSLVRNIGFDGYGTNCGNDPLLAKDRVMLADHVPVYEIPLRESRSIRTRVWLLERSRAIRSLFYRVRRRAKRVAEDIWDQR